MNRNNNHYLGNQMLALLYSSLSVFTESYDNAEKEIGIVLDSIVDVFIEENACINMHYTKEGAIEQLRSLAHAYSNNPRNAGRRPLFNKDEQQVILNMIDSGIPIKDVAKQFNCSYAYVHKLKKQHN